MAKVTIETISRETGLSRGTVSRALNDRPDISPQTKARVLDACKSLNYKPSHAARTLATGRSYSIALIAVDLRSCFTATLMRGVLRRAEQSGYAVHLTELRRDASEMEEQLRRSIDERIDATLVVGALPEAGPGLIRELSGTRPVAAIAGLDGIACDVFSPDHAESGRIVARQILTAGRPLYVDQPLHAAAAMRRQGFEEICRGRGLDPRDVILALPETGGDDLLRDRLGEGMAVGAADDTVALRVIFAALRRGLVPGEDLAVIGQGNHAIGADLSPSLTTTDPCAEEIGRRACEVLIQRLQGDRMDAPEETRVAPRLVERESMRVLQTA